MTDRLPSPGRRPPWGSALAAMLSVQLGSALSVPLIDTVGPAAAYRRLQAASRSASSPPPRG